MGNVHLKWAFSEAGKALSILAHELGRAAYYMLAREKAFDVQQLRCHRDVGVACE
jgi:hypothetical protein